MARVAVVGAGFSGLYAAWLLNRAGLHVDVFEASEHVGGRARQIRFGRKWVAGGAGIGRFDKDHRLKALLLELGFRDLVIGFPHKVNYFPPNQNLSPKFFKLALEKLQRAKPKADETFEDFGHRVLGRPKFKKLIQFLGFSDDLKADAVETLKHYGFEDNYNLGRGMRVPWNKVLRRMAAVLTTKSTRVRIFRNHQIMSLKQMRLRWKCKRDRSGKSGSYDHIFLAGTYESNLRILRRSRIPAPTFRANIRSQPFMYVYANVKGPLDLWRKRLPGYTVLTDVKDKGARLLQKMIPMGGRTYMIGYADNERAKRLAIMSTRQIARLAQRTLRMPGNSLPFSRVLKWYIPVGTHYYRPNTRLTRTQVLDQIQAELGGNITIIGECVSLHHQGWVEGALEAAEKGVASIMKDKKKNKNGRPATHLHDQEPTSPE